MIVRAGLRCVGGVLEWLVAVGFLLTSSCGGPFYKEVWGPPSPPPVVREREQREPVRRGPELELFAMAQRENRRLHWDACLAGVAHERARRMAQSGQFGHRDPKTGKNPAWGLISVCDRYRCAGENLVRGDDTPRAMHRALMDSRTHRENILNPAFDVLGVGCYGKVCVQLFAGY